MTKATTLVLIGPHGAGKTTVGRLVAATLGWEWQHEIGEEVRRRMLARDPGAHAMAHQEAFDEEVITRELERDGSTTQSRVVETWHPGNFAYALRRTPAVAKRLLREALGFEGRVIVQPLQMSLACARGRLSEPGPDEDSLLAFFADVAADAQRLAPFFAEVVLEPLCTDDLVPEAVAARLIERLTSSEFRAPGVGPSAD